MHTSVAHAQSTVTMGHGEDLRTDRRRSCCNSQRELEQAQEHEQGGDGGGPGPRRCPG
jgi:hypothetical protein